ncbi:hypothetical protein ABZS83_18340 [Streptomyces sp. NPDC005426]|uniref:hypothetical protein n=1 Tax=Streptomyces sp. NPDC005426 TaxID=3155344 RepID=UPI0033B1EF3D
MTRPGVVVDTDGLVRSSGEIKVCPPSGPDTRPALLVRLTGQSVAATSPPGPRGGRSHSWCAAARRG